MRLFAAVSMPGEVKNYLYKLQKSINSDSAKIKWVDKKNLHLTLKYFGEIEDKKIDIIKKHLASVKINRFNLKINKFGMFDNKIKKDKYNIILWVSVLNSDGLFNLQKDIDEKTIEFSSKTVDFNPHITLGRVKSIKKRQALFDLLNKLKAEPMQFSVESFKLFNSSSTKDGPKYSVLEEYSLY